MMQRTSPFRLPRKTPFGLGENVAEWATGLAKLDKFYAQRPAGLDTQGFLRYTLQVLGIDYRVVKGAVNHVPISGPTVVIANHPLGCVEGIILAELLLMLRSDVKILANQYLKTVPELDQLFIGVDVFETKNAQQANLLALREANRHLKNDGLLLLFPAGEVSKMVDRKTKKLEDKEWSHSVARLVNKHQATTVPVFIDGQNSQRFYLAGKVHPLLRTLMLGRELLNKQSHCIDLCFGDAIKHKEISKLDDHQLVNYLRLNTYLLGQTKLPAQTQSVTRPAHLTNEDAQLATGVSVQQPIAAQLPIETLLFDIEHIPEQALLLTHQEFAVYCTKAKYIPALMHEIGRQREINFRHVGEGTGKALDLDLFDDDYHHLFIWDKHQQQLVGAYRLGLVDRILERRGLDGLYSRTLFDYNHAFISKMGNAIELGRSMIVQEYQKSMTALLLLWKGIAAFIYRHPHYTHLYGPVSISSDYSDGARQLLAQTLTLHHYDADRAEHVKPLSPLTSDSLWNTDMLTALADLQLLSKVLSRFDQGLGIPVLLRHYLGLNGKLVSFNVDANFNNALDGLILVDLSKVAEKTLARYMGEAEAKQYLTWHQVD